MAELLSVTDVCMSYERGGRRVQVLRNISLGVDAGEIVAVVGSGGEGRTTLLKIVAGMVRPDSGKMRLTGIDLMSLSGAKRTDLLGDQILWITSGPPLPNFKIHDQIAVSLVAGRRHRVRDAKRSAWEALERMGISDCAPRRWSTLSRWERLLLALALGIAARPQLMLIDDLFDGLGPRRTQEAGRLLRSLVDELECGVLLSVSDLESALTADRVWWLAQGNLTRMPDRLSIPPNVALASELYERGYKDAAAVIAGSTLEAHLRKLAAKVNIPTERGTDFPRKADALNNALAGVGTYNRLQQKGVTAWLDLRNRAVHGRYSEYDVAQVSALIRDVSEFLTRYPA